MSCKKDCKPYDRFGDVERITRALKEAVRCALRRHKLLGKSVVVMQEGKITWIKPEDIPVDLDGPID